MASRTLTVRTGSVTLAGDLSPAAGAALLGTVLLLHGGGQTRHSWGSTAQRLAAAGWEAITLDTRGHGDSDRAPGGDYGMDALVADLRATVREIGGTPVLVGASLGGITSLIAEGEQPLARALVLVDVAPRVETEGVDRIVSFMRAEPNGFASLAEAAEAVHAYNPHRRRSASSEGLRRNLRQGADGRWRWHWDPAFLAEGTGQVKVESERARVAAARVRVPTLLVRGVQSDVLGPEGAAELLALVPGSRLVDVSDTGHMVAGDDNDTFARAVLDFLAELS